MTPLSRLEFERVFKIGEIVPSGASNRSNAAHLEILEIADGLVRYKPLNSKTKSMVRYPYLQLLLDGYDQLDPKQIQKSTNRVLKAAGFSANYSTENYCYTLVKAYIERTAVFVSQGETLVGSGELPNGGFSEGERVWVVVEKVERDSGARKACIDFFGAQCAVCKFDFGEVYGPAGSGFIHVHHHRTQLASTKGKYVPDPIADLIPVCPNCHAMIHRNKEMRSIAEIKSLIDDARTLCRSTGDLATQQH